MSLPGCQVMSGEQVQILKGGILRFSDGSTYPHEECYFHPGSAMVLYYETSTEKPDMSSSEPVVLDLETIPSSLEPLERVSEHISVAQPIPVISETVAMPDPATDLVAVTDAASRVGGDYAPILAIVLALLAVFGGRQAWRYYSQRAEQRHELAMAQASQANSRPPQCKTAQLEVDERLNRLQIEVDRLGRCVLDEVDPDEITRSIKKLKKQVKSLKDRVIELESHNPSGEHSG